MDSEKSKAPSAQSPFLTQPFLLLCVYLNCAGWLLSAVHQLNAVGYAVTLAAGAGALAWFHPDFGQIRYRRFRRGFPLGFLILAMLAVLGGFLYAPNNYDGLAYRVPRIFHWLAEGKWHWITAEFTRLNTRSVGWEWMAAPLIALTRSYRWIFLPNVLAFALLPGLIFSLFTRMGVRPRVAWYWMWLLPTGYCFLLQVGGISNDLITAAPTIAAIDFALRAKTSKKLSDVWFSILSAALMTGFKTTNLPLLLVWGIAILPVVPLLRERLLTTLAVLLIATGTSFLPLAALDQVYGGDWTGTKADTHAHFQFRLPGNAATLVMQNFAPPVFPMAAKWNAWVDRTMPARMIALIDKNFEGGIKHLPDMMTEEAAGLGFGLSALLLLSGLASLCGRRASQALPQGRKRLGFSAQCLLLAPWVSLLFLLHKSGGSTVARFITGYYALLIPALLANQAQSRVVRMRWWRIAAGITFGLALLPLVASPARPLWPAQTLLGKLDAAHSSNSLLRRAQTVYSVYAQRADGFAPARPLLPPGLKTLGFLSFDDPEASLWVPMGTLRIEHVTRRESAADLRRRGIEYILANPDKAEPCLAQPFETWVSKMNLQTVRPIPLQLRASRDETNWCLLKLPPN